MTPTTILAERADGQELTFTLQNGNWMSDSDVDITLINSGTTWTLIDHNDAVETYTAISPTEATLTSIKSRNGYTQNLTYNSSNQLASVTDSYSRSLSLTYSGNLLQTVATPEGTTLSYTYTSSGLTAGVLDRLASVGYSTIPGTRQAYLYENALFPLSLTGITDENGNRYATWTFDNTGRAVSNFMGTSANQTMIAYDDTTGNRTLTNALGQAELYRFSTLQGVPKLIEIDRQSTTSTIAAKKTFTYDTSGYTASQTDWDGNLTTFVNDAHGQPTSTVEAAGTAQARTTATMYLSNFHLPMQIVRPGITTVFGYDGSGNLMTKTDTDTTTTTKPYSTNGQARVYSFTYGSYGLPATSKTPRSDVNGMTTYTYTQGALTKVSNALGQSTAITDTPGGRPLTVVDANGVQTTLTYDARQRLTSRAVGTAAGALTTSFGYDAAGNLTSTTLPDGSSLTNTYDAAHRLTQVTDSLGNYTSYILDGLGDRTQTSVYTKAGTLTWQGSGKFDALGRELVRTAGAGQTTTKTYDANGNVLTVADGLNQTTTNTYDSLNRLSTSTDANSAVTTPSYDTNNRVVSVKDANGNTTAYVRDGFGDVIQQSSPDSGVTVFHYDADSNLTSKTDALGIITNQSFDALERPLTTAYPAHTAETVAYTYDQTGSAYGFGIGRLTSVTDAAGTLSRSYNERGDLLSEKRINGSTTLITSYSYDPASRVAGMGYPDGTLVAYAHDVAGYLSGVMVKPAGAATATAVATTAHQPFGPLSNVTYGNGTTETWTFDQSYRPKSIVDALAGTNLQNLAYSYDAANNVKGITDAVNASNSQSFSYDPVNRLMSGVSGAGGYGSQSWTYDKVGNRLTQVQGTAKTSYSYTPGTNQLATITTSAASASLRMPGVRKARVDAGLRVTANSPPRNTQTVATLQPTDAPPSATKVLAFLGWPSLLCGVAILFSFRRSLREHRLLSLIGGILVAGGTAAITGCGSAPSGGSTSTTIGGTSTGTTAATPTFSPAAGIYSSPQTVSISDTTAGAAIYYTVDGTTPTTSSTLYSGPITITTTQTISAIAVASAAANSAVATATYTINLPAAATPTFSPAAGSFTSAQAVSISDATAGAIIYYTVDGSTPTTSSTRYSGPITVTSSVEISAIAVASGYATSAVASSSYTVTYPAAGPVFSPASGTYTTVQTVAISDTTPGAAIYYTVDGSIPTSSSSLYTGPVAVNSSETIQAVAFAANYSPSRVTAASFTLNLAAAPTPTFLPGPGIYATAQTVTISDTAAGATIYYSTDGTAPSRLYTGPITISSTSNLAAMAVAKGYSNSNVIGGTYYIGPRTANPVFSPLGGTFTAAQTVSISDATSGAAIYYTTDGTLPTTSSTLYAGPIAVSKTTTLTAYAVASGYADSAYVAPTYTINSAPLAATPTFSPAAGSYTSPQTVVISDSTPGAAIYYTTNGSAPTAASTVYAGPITVSGNESINAIAVASGYTNSAAATATYTISQQATAVPVFSPAAGSFASSQSVVISDSTPGATIYYTTNGSVPTTGSAVYSGPVTVSSSETINAIAVATGYTTSAAASATYTINLAAAASPSFSPAAGSFSSSQTVTITDATTGAAVYYTTDGTTPTTASTKYVSPISVSSSETIKAIAVASGYTNSPVITAAYTISQPVAATPTFSPAEGTYPSAQSVSISDSTTGAAIYYSTDGTAPTASSAKYSSPIAVTSNETLQALAIANGYTNSAIISAPYTITANSCLTAVTTNANGNITGVPSADGLYCLNFSYNNANRPASVTGGAMAATFVYDWTAQRYSKTSGGTATVYSYAQDGAVIAENNGGTVTDYIYADGRPIATIQPSAPAANQIGYVMADRLGTPQRVVNGAGSTVWGTAYQPFGTTGTVNGGVTQDLRFPGQLADAETGFSYNLNRDYMPNLGRYLETDPIGVISGLDTYAYVSGNPIKYIDKLGLESIEMNPNAYLAWPNYAFSTYRDPTSVGLGFDSTGNIPIDQQVTPEQIFELVNVINQDINKVTTHISDVLNTAQVCRIGSPELGHLNNGYSVISASYIYLNNPTFANYINAESAILGINSLYSLVQTLTRATVQVFTITPLQ